MGRFRITARPATPRVAAAILAELDRAGVDVVISPPVPEDQLEALSSAPPAVSTLTFVVETSDPEAVQAAVRRVHHSLNGQDPDIEIEDESDQE